MNDGTESDQVRIDKEEYDSLVAYDFDTSSIFHDLLDCQECNPNNHLKPPFAQLREPFLDAAILNSGSIVSFVMLK